MRILLVSSSFPRFEGDLFGSFVFELARHLAEDGLDVHVLAPHDAGVRLREDWHGVAIHRFRYVPQGVPAALCYGSGIPDNLKRRPMAWGQIPSYCVALLWTLRRLVERERIQVVNSHWLLMQGVAAARLRQAQGVPHIATVHASELSVLSKLPFGRAVAAYSLRHSDHLVCVSQRTRVRLEALLRSPVSATIMPMGVDVERFEQPTLPRETARATIGARSGRTLLFVGRLVERKGLHILIEALPQVRTVFRDTQVLVAGAGSLEDRLKGHVVGLGLQEHVQFLGPVSAVDLPVYYRAADALVLPSLVLPDGEEEGMPVVVLEALAAGCPVVATRTGGIPELLRDGENAFLASPGDRDALVRAIIQALSSSRSEEFRRSMRAVVEPFDWRRIATAYREAAERLAVQALPAGQWS